MVTGWNMPDGCSDRDLPEDDEEREAREAREEARQDALIEQAEDEQAEWDREMERYEEGWL